MNVSKRMLLLTLFITLVGVFTINIFFQPSPRYATRIEALNPSASTNWQITQSTSQLVGYRQQGGIVDIPEFEVLFDSGAGNSGEESYGVVIETPNEVDQAVLKLNELLLEARGGTSLIWRGDVLADVDALENADNTSETSLKRRPERWDMTVASGIVKARANQAETNVTAAPLPDLRRPMLSLNGFFRARLRPAPRLQNTLAGYTDPIIIPEGVNLSFDERGFTLEPISDDMGFIGGSVFYKSNRPRRQLSQIQIDRLNRTQSLLLLLPNLADAQIAFEYVLEYTLGDNGDDGASFQDETDSSNGEDTDETNNSLIEFLLEQGVSIEALTQVVGDDPFIAEVLVNATFNDPNGIESVRDVLDEQQGNLSALAELFRTIIGEDQGGVDLLILTINDAMTDEFVTRLVDDPILNQLFVERLDQSNAAFESLLDQTETSPNGLKLLISVASGDDSPLNTGTDLLLEVIGSSELALQNLVLALQNDPDTLAQFETLLTDDPTLAGILEQDGTLLVLQQNGLLKPEPTDAPVFVVAQSNPLPVATLAPTLIATLDVPTLVFTPVPTVQATLPADGEPDLPPTGRITSPLNGEAVSHTPTITISFNETVGTNGTWLQVSCGGGLVYTPSDYEIVSSEGKSFTLTPRVGTNLTDDTTCTITLNNENIRDVAAQTLDTSNSLMSVTVTTPNSLIPTATITDPANYSRGVVSPTFRFSFSEAVTMLSNSWFTVNCTSVSYDASAFTMSQSGNVYSLRSNSPFANDLTCLATVNAGQVKDSANNSLATSPIMRFKTPDTIQPVTATVNIDQASVEETEPIFTVTFSEPVLLGDDWFSFNCDGTPHTESSYTVTPSTTLDPNLIPFYPITDGYNTYTLTPNIDPFARDLECNGSISQVLVQDEVGRTAQANYTIYTTTDDAPYITHYNNSGTVWYFYFSEPVTVGSHNAFCTGFLPSIIISSGMINATTFEINHFSAIAPCYLTISKGQISDQDTLDPSNNPHNDISINYHS